MQSAHVMTHMIQICRQACDNKSKRLCSLPVVPHEAVAEVSE